MTAISRSELLELFAAQVKEAGGIREWMEKHNIPLNTFGRLEPDFFDHYTHATNPTVLAILGYKKETVFVPVGETK